MSSALLKGRLPDTVMVGEKTYRIHTDFRNWVRLESVLFEEDGAFILKIPKLLTSCYRDLPDTLEDAAAGMISFYMGPEDAKKPAEMPRREKPVYSFWQDGELIYAAFYQQYGIDLTAAQLHWWQFKALFCGLTEDTQFAKVMRYRAVDLSLLSDPGQKRFYRKMKELYKLRDTRSDEERDVDVSLALESLF